MPPPPVGQLREPGRSARPDVLGPGRAVPGANRLAGDRRRAGSHAGGGGTCRRSRTGRPPPRRRSMVAGARPGASIRRRGRRPGSASDDVACWSCEAHRLSEHRVGGRVAGACLGPSSAGAFQGAGVAASSQDRSRPPPRWPTAARAARRPATTALRRSAALAALQGSSRPPIAGPGRRPSTGSGLLPHPPRPGRQLHLEGGVGKPGVPLDGREDQAVLVARRRRPPRWPAPRRRHPP